MILKPHLYSFNQIKFIELYKRKRFIISKYYTNLKLFIIQILSKKKPVRRQA
jgi:hypothetical protein